ncbi:MAG TPA: YSC84-related protein [Gammaproteobacteria bacterium]
MTQLTIGFQLGGQAFSQIIFFEDKRAYEEFISGNFEFGAQASAVGHYCRRPSPGEHDRRFGGSDDKGTQAPVSYHKGMAVFTVAKGGLMYEASIGGQKFSFEPVGKK